MKTLEVDEILRILEKCGWQAWLCDTPVPVYESVHAGDSADPGQNAPVVRGKRYQAYRALADRTTELLTMKDNEFRLL